MMGVLFAGVPEDEQKTDPDFRCAVDLLRQAAREAVDDLSDRSARKVLERVRRVHHSIVAPYSGEGEDVGKFGLIAFYWIKDLVETGYFVFAEGSAIDRALTLYITAIEHKAAISKLDASARKQSRKMIRRLQATGYYAGLAMDAAQIADELGDWEETAP
ncbi:hypothetical protein [Ancylobacter defluvii]|nr:hypothetical protein [Ancylobacter defluvii]MBS7588235.1 hypothetical protein [Ancylobacter defluvii]